jgi:hypothetical protein
MIQKSSAKLFLVLTWSLLLQVPTGSSAQSLGEIARQYRKEREALREKGEAPARVFTNDDIARMPPIATLKSSQQAPTASDTIPPAPSLPPGTPGGRTSAGTSAAKPAKAEDKMRSPKYWQAKFKTVRAALARAQEEQTLVEDELRLLQIQQARELDPDRSRILNGQIDAATVNLKATRALTEKAQSALDEIEKEFKQSGAPQGWAQDDKGSN